MGHIGCLCKMGLLFPETGPPVTIDNEYIEQHQRVYSTYLQHAQLETQLCEEFGIGEFGYVVGKDPNHFLVVTRKLDERRKEFVAGGKNMDECRQRECVWPFQDTVDVGHNPRGAVTGFMDR